MRTHLLFLPPPRPHRVLPSFHIVGVRRRDVLGLSFLVTMTAAIALSDGCCDNDVMNLLITIDACRGCCPTRCFFFSVNSPNLFVLFLALSLPFQTPCLHPPLRFLVSLWSVLVSPFSTSGRLKFPVFCAFHVLFAMSYLLLCVGLVLARLL